MQVKIQQLCSSAIYKQNVSISLCLSDSAEYRRGLYFRDGWPDGCLTFEYQIFIWNVVGWMFDFLISNIHL